MFRQIRHATLAAAAMLSLCLGSAQAAPTLIVQNGVLRGADNVVVNNVSYDVRFVDGNCANLFTGCNAASDFAFDTKAEADGATLVLLRDVLVDGPAGRFDSLPQFVNGCGTSRCMVFTPYRNEGSRVRSSSAWNTTSRDRVNGARLAARSDTTSSRSRTYAVWTVHQDGTTTTTTNTGTNGGTGGGTGDNTSDGTFLEVLQLPQDEGTGGSTGTGGATANGVPEPGSLALLTLALLPIAARLRRRQPEARKAARPA